MSSQDSKENARTSDTAFAAYLQSEGLMVLERDSSSPRVFFVFDIAESDKKFIEFKRLFYSGKASVEPSTFQRNYRMLAKQAKREGAF